MSISSRNSKNELATKQSHFIKPLTRVFHIASKNLVSSSVEQGDCFAARVELSQVYLSTNSTEARNDDMGLELVRAHSVFRVNSIEWMTKGGAL